MKHKIRYDQKSCTKEEVRAIFIAEALGQCLTPELEDNLKMLIQDASQYRYIRKHAVYALATTKEKASKQFLLELFINTMQQKREERHHGIFRALIRAMQYVKDKKAVPGLLQVIEEQIDSLYLDEISPAIDALGEIGDSRGINPLKELLITKWVAIAPSICLALAKLNVREVPDLIEEAKERVGDNWTSDQLKIFKEAVEIANSLT